MRGVKMSGQSVRRNCPVAFLEVSGNHRTDGRTVAGHLAGKTQTNNNLQLSGVLSGAVRTVLFAAVCPVGVSIGHPTPDTRTQTAARHGKGARRMGKHYEFEGEYKGDLFISYGRLSEWMTREREFQETLAASDPRHWRMFEFGRDDDGNEWVDIFWGGYAYPYELNRISRPEDLMWLLVHISEKEWKHFTGYRAAALIKAVAYRKGWPAYGVAPHPNEAPRPNPCATAERAKITAVLRYDVIKRDGYRCRACGFSVQDGAHLHIDHIVPISKGGSSAIGNLQTLCTACNIGKGAR